MVVNTGITGLLDERREGLVESCRYTGTMAVGCKVAILRVPFLPPYLILGYNRDHTYAHEASESSGEAQKLTKCKARSVLLPIS